MINKKNLFHKGLIFMLIFYVHSLKSIKDDYTSYPYPDVLTYIFYGDLLKDKLRKDFYKYANIANKLENVLHNSHKMEEIREVQEELQVARNQLTSIMEMTTYCNRVGYIAAGKEIHEAKQREEEEQRYEEEQRRMEMNITNANTQIGERK